MHSRLLTGVLAAAATGLAAAPAHAAPPANSTEVKIVGSVLFITALGSQENNIHINIVNDRYNVFDLASPTFANGGGCTAVNPTRVDCPMLGVTRAVINTDGGDDHILGAPRTRNELHGGAGDDEVFGMDQIDTLDGGPGDDVLGGLGGVDLADYRGRTNGVLVTLDGIDSDGEPGENDEIRNDVEGVIGGDGNDTLSGSWAPDRLQGGPGDDSLWGSGSGDVLTGGPGVDSLNGGEGPDTFEADATADGADTFNGNGGTGDLVTYSHRTTSVLADLDGVADDGAWGEGDNIATDVENITGGSRDDILVGDGDPNQLTGGDGDDRLAGRGGDDYVTGGNGNDTGWGDDGVDNINGGPGNDTSFGGAGNDTLFARDFVLGNDTLFAGADTDTCTADAGDAKTDCER